MKTSLLGTLGPNARLRSPVLWRLSRADSIVTVELREWLPAITFVLLLLSYLAAPTELVAMALATLGGLLLFSLLWALTMARRVRGSRDLQYAAVQVGDELEEIVSLVNDSALPVLWAEFTDSSNLPGYAVSGIAAADPKSTFEWRAQSVCSRRGVFLLGPWELRLGDPFGLFQVRQTHLERKEVVVHPPIAALASEFLPHGGILGESRPRRHALSAEPNDAFTTREYVPGDPLRFVHWRTTAHNNSPFVKVFEPEAASVVWLVPDCDANAHYGETEETTVTLAASLAARLLNEHLAVGLLFQSDRFEVIPPQRDPPHLWTLLRALATLRSQTGHPLAGTLARARVLVGGRDLVVVLTPSPSVSWVRELKQLAWLHHGSGAHAILLEPTSFGRNARLEPCISLLAELGLGYKIVARGDVKPISGAYGTLSRWEFKTLATGGVQIKQSPRRSARSIAKLNPLEGQMRGNG